MLRGSPALHQHQLSRGGAASVGESCRCLGLVPRSGGAFSQPGRKATSELPQLSLPCCPHPHPLHLRVATGTRVECHPPVPSTRNLVGKLIIKGPRNIPRIKYTHLSLFCFSVKDFLSAAVFCLKPRREPMQGSISVKLPAAARNTKSRKQKTLGPSDRRGRQREWPPLPT